MLHEVLDADVKRRLASVSALVDGGSAVVLGQQESYIGNECTGQRIPMSRRRRVFRDTAERSDWIEGERKGVGFQEAGVTSNVREFGECCKTKVTLDVRKDSRRGSTAWTTTRKAKGLTIARQRRSSGAGNSAQT